MSTCEEKFSVHMVVKHEEHMFACLAHMHEFIKLLKTHPDWEECATIVDTAVYNKNQLFRAPCAVKPPTFDLEARVYHAETVKNSNNNVLLPVDSLSGDQLLPVISASRPHVFLSLYQWTRYLVTSGWSDRHAEPFPAGSCTLSLQNSTFNQGAPVYSMCAEPCLHVPATFPCHEPDKDKALVDAAPLLGVADNSLPVRKVSKTSQLIESLLMSCQTAAGATRSSVDRLPFTRASAGMLSYRLS